MKFRRVVRKLIQDFLPESLRYALIRRGLRLENKLPSGMIIRIARTQQDLESAFRLLHDCYVSSEFMDPDPSGMRVTKYHALPSTTTIVALIDEKVVGTVSLIRRSAFGMPLEKIFDLNQVIESGERLLEVSALAIDKAYSGNHGQILMPMCKYLVNYSHRYFGVNYLAIAVHPKWLEFYRAVFLFEPLKESNVVEYEFVKGAPAVGGLMNLRNFFVNSKRIYGGKRFEKNISNYINKVVFSELEFPERKIAKINDPVLTPELIDYFFNIKTKVFSEMTERELWRLYELYQDERYRKLLPPKATRLKSSHLERSQSRHEVNLFGKINLPGELSISIVVYEVSAHGLAIFSDRGLRAGEKVTIEICYDEKLSTSFNATAIWQSSRGRAGLHIINPTVTWLQYIATLQNDLIKQAG